MPDYSIKVTIFVSQFYSKIQNTCAKVKLCLFLFTSVQEIICCKTEVFNAVSFGQVQMDLLKTFLYR